MEVAGKKLSSPQEFQGVVEQTQIGVRQTMTVMRNGHAVTLEVVPAEQPADYGLVRVGDASGGHRESVPFEKLGIKAETLTADTAKRLGVKTDTERRLPRSARAARRPWRAGKPAWSLSRPPTSRWTAWRTCAKSWKSTPWRRGCCSSCKLQGTHFMEIRTGD